MLFDESNSSAKVVRPCLWFLFLRTLPVREWGQHFTRFAHMSR